MDVHSFVAALAELDADDLRAVADAISEHRRTVADEVEAWEDMMCIDDALRQTGRTRDAAQAAHAASQAVLAAAARSGIELPDTTVTRVAREAALLARGLVAGDDAVVAVRHMLPEWRQVSTAA